VSEKAVTAVNQVPVAQFNAVSGADDYFQTVVINALLVILKDQALSSHHHTVIEAVMSIFKTQGLKCVTFLPQVCWLMACEEWLFLCMATPRSSLPLLLLLGLLLLPVCRSSIYNNSPF
jgi:hypothetical protein